MLKAELTKSKIKRILIYFEELHRYKIHSEAVNSLICYVFSISERWLYQILKDNSKEQFEDVKLLFLEGDLKLIDAYAQKIIRDAKKERKQEKTY